MVAIGDIAVNKQTNKQENQTRFLARGSHSRSDNELTSQYSVGQDFIASKEKTKAE